MKKYFHNQLIYKLIIPIFILASSCKSDDPAMENVPEIISKITLEFISEGGDKVIVSAMDPDNDGPKNITTDGTITLAAGTAYTLSLSLINELSKPGEQGHSITEEIQKEGDEHQFFYAWKKGLFTNPAGSGNIDEPGKVNYIDKDENGLPLGLTTSWVTGQQEISSAFRILLQHQPEIKSTTSSAKDGESDLDVTFQLVVE